MLDMEYDPEPPFEGGSPEESSAVIARGMEAMYDVGFARAEEALGYGSSLARPVDLLPGLARALLSSRPHLAR